MATRRLVIDVNVNSAQATQRLRVLDQHVSGVGASARQTGSLVQRTIGIFAGFVSAQVAINGVRAAFSFASRTAIEMNAKLETTRIQFEGLTGSADRAREIVDDLFTFAKRTPFETGPIIEASRLMQSFGGDALNTMENLRLIGDAAAGSGQSIERVAFWVGRMYSNLDAGKPIGEAASNLQEMSVLSGQARIRLEEMAASTHDAKVVFEVFREELSQFTGQMERQAETWNGVLSTFWDTVSLTIAENSTGAFQLFKRAVQAATEEVDRVGFSLSVFRDISRLVEESLRGNRSAFFSLIDTLRMTNAEYIEAQEIQKGLKVESLDLGRVQEYVGTSADQALRLMEPMIQAQDRAREETKKLREEQERLAEALRQSTTDIRDNWQAYVVLTRTLPEVRQNIDLTAVSVLNATNNVEQLSIGLIDQVKNFGNLRDALQNPPGLLRNIGSSVLDLGRQFTDVGGIMNSVAMGVFGPQGMIAGLVSQGMQQVVGLAAKGLQKLGGVVWGGLKKIGGFFKSLFGGPSAKELAGREIVDAFQDNLAQMLSDQQLIESGNIQWKNTVIAVRDAYLAQGRTVEEALADVERLWKSSKDGPEAAARVIDEITWKMENFANTARASSLEVRDLGHELGGLQSPNIVFPAVPSIAHGGGLIQAFPTGGPVRGMGDHVPILAQPGEFVMRRSAVNRLGAGTLAAMNAGGGAGVNVTINVEGGFLDSPASQRKLATLVQDETRKALQFRRQFV